ncbi:hypothetical protein HKD37_08G022704 [Glycine soja]
MTQTLEKEREGLWEGEDWLKEESWPCPGLNVRQDYKGSIPLLSGICRMETYSVISQIGLRIRLLNGISPSKCITVGPKLISTTDTRRIIKLWDGLPLIGKGKPLVSMITTKQPCCRDTIYTSALEPLHSKECSRGWLWRTLSLHVPLTLNCLQNCKVCCLLMCQSSFVNRAFLPGFHYFASRMAYTRTQDNV